MANREVVKTIHIDWTKEYKVELWNLHTGGVVICVFTERSNAYHEYAGAIRAFEFIKSGDWQVKLWAHDLEAGTEILISSQLIVDGEKI